VREAVQRLAMSRGHYHGYPLPDDTCRLVLHEKFPVPMLNGYRLKEDDADEDRVCMLDEVTLARIAPVLDQLPHATILNHWFDYRRQEDVVVYRLPSGKSCHMVYQNSVGAKADKLLMTIGVSMNWDMEAELTAQAKLADMLASQPHKMKQYLQTGMFLEKSDRSNVMYILRRCRPTLAVSMSTPGLKVMCALCMHPIGYYEGSFAGGMVATDDVIAHLTLIRGDEWFYWKSCNQHSPWLPEAGL
jgi:hypothetical protein